MLTAVGSSPQSAARFGQDRHLNHAQVTGYSTLRKWNFQQSYSHLTASVTQSGLEPASFSDSATRSTPLRRFNETLLLQITVRNLTHQCNLTVYRKSSEKEEMGAFRAVWRIAIVICR
ncbi:hypothetical protein HAX54_048247 [Datura stramonium]|uniref:Uncharacterized protein n=1 Tax=Datura stramonium TaxID=4076 RepID=A0ABS8WL49_DATST|nr:hypothetical protein [Datura stramonium]